MPQIDSKPGTVQDPSRIVDLILAYISQSCGHVSCADREMFPGGGDPKDNFVFVGDGSDAYFDTFTM